MRISLSDNVSRLACNLLATKVEVIVQVVMIYQVLQDSGRLEDLEVVPIRIDNSGNATAAKKD